MYLAAPGKPEKLKHEVLGNSSVLLTWQPPQENYGPITKYHVDYWGVEKNFQTVEVTTSNKDKIEYVLNDLQSYTFYQVRVNTIQFCFFAVIFSSAKSH